MSIFSDFRLLPQACSQYSGYYIFLFIAQNHEIWVCSQYEDSKYDPNYESDLYPLMVLTLLYPTAKPLAPFFLSVLWEFPKIWDTLFWGPYYQDPTI